MNNNPALGISEEMGFVKVIAKIVRKKKKKNGGIYLVDKKLVSVLFNWDQNLLRMTRDTRPASLF